MGRIWFGPHQDRGDDSAGGNSTWEPPNFAAQTPSAVIVTMFEAGADTGGHSPQHAADRTGRKATGSVKYFV
jgi:hypothetical protein